MYFRFGMLCWMVLVAGVVRGETITVVAELHHLRGEFGGGEGAVREWSDFEEAAEGGRLVQRFDAKANASEATLFLYQADVKQSWGVMLNGKKIGALQKDENAREIAFAVPSGGLRDGGNELVIEYVETRERGPDDIWVGQVKLDGRPMAEALNESRLVITVIDEGTGRPTPCRVTIADTGGTMMQTGAVSDDRMAVRPGVIYSGDGQMEIGLPAGRYMVYAGRGFEYSLDHRDVKIKVGGVKRLEMRIRREVSTEGLVSSDPHIHTLTFAGHGDATISERMLTIAGENVELPISTEHNKHIDYESEARRMGLRKYFTPVLGNEMSSKVGHFNIFPILKGAQVADHTPVHWGQLYENMFNTPGVEVVSLNHGRDLHGNRPLGAEAFNAAIGENKEGWEFRINAMEVVNSGAIQTDPLTLYRDWFALMNRGVNVVGVGSSDTHYVANHFVGQGRTYLAADDSDLSNIDARGAVREIAQGKALVSYGLLTQMKLSKRRDGGGGGIDARVNVQGPSWVDADRLMIFRNGVVVYDEEIDVPSRGTSAGKGGITVLYSVVKLEETIVLENPDYDAHFVAIAMGPGELGPYWPLAKPYQPTSPRWEPRVLGSSAVARTDGDGDGEWSSAYDYAREAVAKHGGDLVKLVAVLSGYDEAVAAQAAGLLDKLGVGPGDERLRAAIEGAGEAGVKVRAGVEAYALGKEGEGE